MGSTDGENRLIARCENCGRLQTARRLDDGSLLLIGTGRTCGNCGASEFEPLPESE